MKYKQANLFNAPIVLLFSKNKYIEMAIYHNMAINLKAKDLNEMFLRGEYPAEGWEVSYKKIAEQKRKHLINKLCVSFCWILVASFLAIVFGFFTCNLFPIYTAKLSGFVGTFLASWATLFELGGTLASWKGEALHEKIHPILFQILFIPGICLILTTIIM